MPAQAPPELRDGIEIIEGPPGSGKSYWAVLRMLRALEHERRPVFTNLPLRWRVIREYLRKLCGEKVAGLIFELKKDHFDEFMARAVRRAAFHDRHRDIRLSPAAQYAHLDAEFVAQEGPDVIFPNTMCSLKTREVMRPNWIPPASLIIIDEAHKWYPMKAQSKESPHLLDCLSMHRHMMLWVWVLTQDKTNLSISFRKLYQVLVQVRNLREDRLVWGLKMKHFGIRGMGYRAWMKEQVEGKATAEQGSEPIIDDLVYPWMPHNKVIFRLYSSFSQMASLREIERSLTQSRVSLGLDAVGRQEEAVESTGKEERSWLQRLVDWL